MTSFLNLTRLCDEEADPFLVNPNLIMCVFRSKNYETRLKLSDGSVWDVQEPLTDVLDMLDARSTKS